MAGRLRLYTGVAADRAARLRGNTVRPRHGRHPTPSRGRASFWRRRRAVRQPVAQEPAQPETAAAQREGITCYRLYDADLPDYNLVVDIYGDWVHVQEYAPPAEIDPTKVRRRLLDALAVIGSILAVPPERVVLKERRRQRGSAQYERRADAGDFEPVARG